MMIMFRMFPKGFSLSACGRRFNFVYYDLAAFDRSMPKILDTYYSGL